MPQPPKPGGAGISQGDEAIRLPEAKYRLAFQLNPDAAGISRLRDGALVDLSDGFFALTGYDREEVAGKTTIELDLWAEAEDRRRLAERLLASGQVDNFEAKFRVKDGRVLAGLVSAVLLDMEGEPHIYFTIKSIQDLKEAQRALAQSEERFRLAMEATKDGLWDWNVETGDVYFSPGYFEILGYGAGEMPEELDSWTDSIHPADLIAALKKNQDCIDNRIDSFETEFRMLTRSRDWKWILGRGKAVARDAEGRAIRMVGTHTDITVRKLYEEALARSEAHLRRMIDLANEGILTTDADFNIAMINPKMEQMLGLPEAEILGRSTRDFLFDEDVSSAREKESRRRQGIQERFERRFRRADGTVLWTIVSASPLFDDAGRFQGTLAMLTDITERKRIEEEVNASLREKEALLKEIHHRVKNNMQVISSMVGLQRLGAGDKDLKAILREIQSRVKAMATVHEVLYRSESFSRIALGSYIEKLADSLVQSYGLKEGQVALALDGGGVEVDIELASPLGLVVGELMTNALKHAFPDGRSGRIAVTAGSLPDGRGEVVVEDDGVGMPAGLEWRSGDTLGLRLVAELVEKQLGGSLELEAVPRGTRLRIIFRSRRPESA